MKLTVIIPCYNCSTTLPSAVSSVYRQNLGEPFELILVDDCSTDDTWKIASALEKKHNNLKLFRHNKNLGGGAARNTALAHATGEVIFCLDSDDLLPDGTLSKMLNFLSAHNCDGVTVERSIKFSGDNVENIHHIDKSQYAGQPIPFESLLSGTESFFPLYVNFMYTKKAADQFGGYPVGHGYDTQGFAWRFLCSGFTAYTCPDAEYLHRINFNESYYLREYNRGKINYNWRDILLEHYYIFNQRAIDFILKFDCRDFTRDIMGELAAQKDILIPNYHETFGKTHPPLNKVLPKINLIPRNSPLGYYLRTKHRLKTLLNKK